MPLYDAMGDKHCVIIDLGHAYTKCGFAREPSPRFIIPSEISYADMGKSEKIWDYKNQKDLLIRLKDFIHMLYFKFLVVNPKDRRVVIVESFLCPTEFRDTLAKVLFMDFEVPSIIFLPSHLMTTYTLKISSAMVVDVGYSETLVLPIYEKVALLNAWEAVSLGAYSIHKRLEMELMQKGKVKIAGEADQELGKVLNEPLVESIYEDIKVRTCFVTPINRSIALQKYSFSQTFPSSTPLEECPPPIPPPSVNYPIDGEKVLNIPGTLREMAPEVLFEQDSDGYSVATVVLESLLKCPLDIRKTLMENLVIIGGCSMIPGFKQRFMAELKSLLKDSYAKKLPIKTIKMHMPPAKENYVSWLGGAIFGATDGVVMHSISRDAYITQGYISDWSDQKWLHGINPKTLI